MLISAKIGCSAHTQNEWVEKVEVDSGKRAGVPTYAADRMKALERENSDLCQANEILMKRTFNDVTQVLSLTAREMRIGRHVVKVANCPKRLVSDVAGELSHAGAIGACYYDGPKGRVFSLRQRSEGIAVNAITELYGG